ncbi:unnamed protein product [Calypogeia fissa]
MAGKGESSTVRREKKVVLFGKTGGGKSTIANALVTGGTGDVIFKSSDGAQGCTQDFQQESGRGWTVLDTIGPGEAAPTANIGRTDTKPEERLKDYLKKVKSEYSHIIYVMKGARVTTIDEAIWCLFTEIFKGGEAAFVIVFTGVDEDWLEAEREKFPAEMKTVENIIVVDIPPKNKREVLERLHADQRREEIQKLEAELERFFAERNFKDVQPNICHMNDDGLRTEAKSIIEKVVKKLKSLFTKDNMMTVIRVLSVVVGLAAAVFGPGVGWS